MLCVLAHFMYVLYIHDQVYAHQRCLDIMSMSSLAHYTLALHDPG